MGRPRVRNPELPKYIAPRRRPDTTRRPRLNRRLNDALDRDVIVICAPAGYGKSTLVVDWLDDSGLPYAWLSLDRQDRDPRVLVRDLAGAVNAAFPGAIERFGRQLESSGGSSEAAAFVGPFAAAVEAGVDDLFMLVLDDVHVLADSPAAEALELLLGGVPMNVRLVIVTRSWDAPPGLARLVSSRQATVLLEEDLAFDDKESGQLLRRSGVRDAEARRELVERAGGWAAALAVLGEYHDPGAPERGAARSAFVLSDFLDREVLARLSLDELGSLEACAVLETFDVELASAMTRDRRLPSLLRDLEIRTQLIARIGTHGMFRVHKLLAQHLLARLARTDPVRLHDLRTRAHALYVDRGEYARAIEVALDARSWSEAAETVSGVHERLYQRGEWDTLVTWIDALPSEVLDLHPGLAILRARLALKLSQASDGLERLDAIERSRLTVEESLRADIYRAIALRHVGRLSESLDAFRWLRPKVEAFLGNQRLCAELNLEEAVTLGTSGRLFDAIGSAEAAVAGFRDLSDAHRTAEALDCLALSFGRLGRAPESMRAFESARRIWKRVGDPRQLLTVESNLADTRHLRGDYAAARPEFLRIVHESERFGFQRVEAYARHNLAIIAHELDELDAAESWNETARRLADGLEDALLRSSIRLEHALLLRSRGAIPEATAAFVEGLLAAEDGGWPEFAAQFRSGLGAVTAVQDGRRDEGVALLELALSEAKRLDDPRTEALTRLRLAGACLMEHRLEEAHELVARLPDLTARVGGLSFLFDEARQQSIAVNLLALDESLAPFVSELRRQVRQAGQSSGREIGRDEGGSVEVRTLGVTSVVVSGKMVQDSAWRSDRAREMLVLLLWRGKPMGKEEIAVTLWPEIEPHRVNSAFHSTLFRLRRAIDSGSLVVRTGDGLYALDPARAIHLDARDFADSVDEAIADRDSAAEKLRAALTWYLGPFLQGADAAWATEVRSLLESKYIAALLELARDASVSRSPLVALECSRRILECDPFNEMAMRLQLVALAELGRAGAVDSAYRRYAQLVEEEIGERPSRSMRDLHQRLMGALDAAALGST